MSDLKDRPRGPAEKSDGRSKLENAAQSPGATGVPAKSVFDFVGQKADERRGEGSVHEVHDRAEAEDNAANEVFGRDSSVTIGVLALQGAVREHEAAVLAAGADCVPVRRAEEIARIDGLIIPGGESTAISRLIFKHDLAGPIREAAAGGMPVFGTCAGLILLARSVVEDDMRVLSLMDIMVRRNAFGRQKDSFETEVDLTIFPEQPLQAVFIRAPWVEAHGEAVKVLATHDEKAVLVEDDNCLACAFHPELTEDDRVHSYFVDKVKKARVSRAPDLLDAARP